nr:MAG TPA: hypothetical protein [Bacteriophage sp.]
MIYRKFKFLVKYLGSMRVTAYRAFLMESSYYCSPILV